MIQNEFVHLHVHSEYSLLDGACKLKELVKQVKALGQKAVALTDHGVMYGAVSFYKLAKEEGIKPIIGCEVYVAPRNCTDKVHGIDNAPYHLILLCENQKGYENLIQLVSKSYKEGFYGKPRVDRSLLKQYHEGLICLSACLAGEIARNLLNDSYEIAKETASFYQDLFGKDHYYIELQNHGIPEQLAILPQLYRLSKELGIPMVATNDSHYLQKTDAEVQQILLCIQTNHLLGEDTGFSFHSDEFYLKSTEEMNHLFSEYEDAIANTVKIAERCSVEFDFEHLTLPQFHTEATEDNETYFRKMCLDGLKMRYGTEWESYLPRLNYEMDTISQMGFVNYFLIVWDFISYAKEHDIPVGPGRGSGAGSLCAYCMGITNIDPMKFHLLFERFLNPERVTMPDFDVDFCVEGRQQVMDYVTHKYGRDYVSQIVAFDTMKARAAIRDVGRVLALPYQTVDAVAKMIPQTPKAVIEDALNQSELTELMKKNKDVERLIQLAQKIEGMPRHITIHPAGVVITPIPVANLVPMRTVEDTFLTQYTKDDLESLGLLKIDFLGLRNLTVIDKCVKLIRKQEPSFQMEPVSLNQQGVYQLLSKGKTLGVFQLESPGIRRVLMQMQPNCIEDIISVLALYRPGPMESIPNYLEYRRHPETISYAHPLLEPILSETYGCILYQEQVMQIFRDLAGYSYGGADIVRRMMSKKKVKEMQEERSRFLHGEENSFSGALAKGIPEEVANKIFDQMVHFASYAFNKSHAAAYAHIAYWTAYLKCFYFKEYFAALLSSVQGNTEKQLEYMDECSKWNVKILPPHVNISQIDFSVEESGIRFGLLSVRNVGMGLIHGMLQERKENGSFRSFEDFCSRMIPHGLNKKALESLILCGALDGMDAHRKQMLQNVEYMLGSIHEQRNSRVEGQMSLFGEQENTFVFPYVPEFTLMEQLRLERETMGLYLSGHPVTQYDWLRYLWNLPNCQTCKTMKENQSVAVLAMIGNIKKIKSKSGEMCFLDLEDETAMLSATVFPNLYSAKISNVKTDALVYIIGKINIREEKITIICDNILSEREFLAEAEKNTLCIKLTSQDTRKMDEVLQISKAYPGLVPLCFYLTDSKKLIKPNALTGVKLNRDLCDLLKIHFESKDIRLIQKKI